MELAATTSTARNVQIGLCNTSSSAPICQRFRTSHFHVLIPIYGALPGFGKRQSCLICQRPIPTAWKLGATGTGAYVYMHLSMYVPLCVCVWWSVSDQTAVKAKKSAAGSCDKPHVPGAFAYVSRHRFAFCAKFHWKKLTISDAGNATARYQVRACRLRGVTATNLGDLGPAAATAAATVHLRNQNPTTDNASTHESGYHKAGCWCPWTMRVDPRLHGLVGAIGNGTGVRPLGSICWEPWRFLFAFFFTVACSTPSQPPCSRSGWCIRIGCIRRPLYRFIAPSSLRVRPATPAVPTTITTSRVVSTVRDGTPAGKFPPYDK